MKREIQAIIKALVGAGWSSDYRDTHYKVKHPKGGTIVISATPSDHRALLNIKGDIKRLKRKHGEVPNVEQ